MTERKNRSLDEVIAILGQPAEAWITKSQSENLPKGINAVRALKVDVPVEGAFRILKWQCTPIPPDAKEIAAELSTLRAKPDPEANEMESLVSRARSSLEAKADRCIAASRIQNGETKTWVMIRVCSRHSRSGLVEDHTWGTGS